MVEDRRSVVHVSRRSWWQRGVIYRRLIWLRRGSLALHTGTHRPCDDATAGVFAYLREGGGESMLVGINFLNVPGEVRLPDRLPSGRVLCSSERERDGREVVGALPLAPNEGCIIRLT